PPALQVVTVTVVGSVPYQVRQSPPVFPQVRERHPHVALALVPRVVHRDQEAVLTGDVPGERQEAVPGPVPLPGGNALEQLPLTRANGRPGEHAEEAVVELGQLLVDRLFGTPSEVR